MQPEHSNQQEALRRSEDRYRKIIDEVEDYAILLLDNEGNIENWNKGAEKIKGYTAQEIIGKNFRQFYTQKDRANKLPERLLLQATTQGKANDEGWRVRKDGTEFWGTITITALHDDKNHVIGFTKVTRDLTERKLAEDKLREHARQLEIQNKELEQFAYIASHDLQEPLRTISSFVELLHTSYKGKLDANADKYLHFISEAAERMRELIKSLLDYSRIGRERSLEKVDCNTIVAEVIADLYASIQESNANIKVEELPALNVYPIEFKLLFQNLLSNAIKFSKKDKVPQISVAAQKKNGLWEFSVTDNAIGVEERFLEKIFIIFQRLHTRKEYEGTGIGLAHCKKIVALHGGDIWAKSQPNKGSTFYFTIKIM